MLPLLSLFLLAVAAEKPLHYGYLPMQNPDLFEGDIVGVDDPNDRNAIVDTRLRWTNGVIPYVIDYSLNIGNVKSLIAQAIQNYHQQTCLKFVPRTNQRNYIKLFNGEGCYSYVGMVGGEQPVSLGNGCHFVGTIVHELGHAIGFYHEQNRSDRDQYLTIYWDNIQSGMASQFALLLVHQNLLLSPFDTNSIMCYGNYAFSKSRSLPTMVAKSGVKLYEPYDKPGLAASDIQRISKLYC